MQEIIKNKQCGYDVRKPGFVSYQALTLTHISNNNKIKNNEIFLFFLIKKQKT